MLDTDRKAIEQTHRQQARQLNRRELYSAQAERQHIEHVRECTVQTLIDGIRMKQPKHERALHAFVDFCSNAYEVTPEEFVLLLESCDDEIWDWTLADVEAEIANGEWTT